MKSKLKSMAIRLGNLLVNWLLLLLILPTVKIITWGAATVYFVYERAKLEFAELVSCWSFGAIVGEWGPFIPREECKRRMQAAYSASIKRKRGNARVIEEEEDDEAAQ